MRVSGERYERLAKKIELHALMDAPAQLDIKICADLLKDFAREIRNEALEEAAKLVDLRDFPKTAEYVRALKTDALAASAKEE